MENLGAIDHLPHKQIWIVREASLTDCDFEVIDTIVARTGQPIIFLALQAPVSTPLYPSRITLNVLLSTSV